jgi:hypothetical protein
MTMRKQGFITLYFDPEAYKAEEGSKLTGKMLRSFGKDMNEQAAHFMGYEGWVTGWLHLPDKRLTAGSYTDQVMALSETGYAHLSIGQDDKVTGVVCHKRSGTEFDVGERDGKFYCNDDEGVYYEGETLAQALAIGYAAQKEH